MEDDECQVLRRVTPGPALFEQIARVDQFRTGSSIGRLRRQFPDDMVRAAVAIHELRRRAANKFTRADQMWFDRKGYEQSTAEAVAYHKAQRFEGQVLDMCCGIGGDALALASRCLVTAVDLNPAACLRAKWNAEVYDVATSRGNALC